MAIFNLGTADESTSDNNQEQKVEEQTEEVTNNQNTTSVSDKTEEDKKTIVLDGPLSHIYTQALNVVYANEATNMLTQMMVDQEENETGKNPYGKDVYVYCCDGNNLTNDDLMETSNKLRIALDKKKYSKVLLSIECHGVVNNRIGLLHDYSVSLGIPVSYTQSGSINNIKTALESI